MTIVAAVKSRDCLVIGTDSMTQVIGPGVNGTTLVLKSYSNATKLFQLGDLPIAIATWGAGNLGSLSVGGLVSEFQSHVTPAANLQAIAQELSTFIQTSYIAAYPPTPPPGLPPPQQPNPLPILGFFIGGYSGNQPLPELWEVRFPGPSVTRIWSPQDSGAAWRGIEIPFTRLHFGADPRIKGVLTQAGVDASTIQQVTTGFQSPVIFDSMPIQDAVGFAEYILRTTIGFTTYETGSPSCGEPIQVAVIVRRKGYVWVHEPKFHV
jgi:hypothetical protein